LTWHPAQVGYLLAGQQSEVERLQQQSRVWEPAGRRLLAELETALNDAPSLTAVDVGCGALGWLRILDDWVGPDGRVIGTDVDPQMLALARAVAETERLTRVRVVEDDLFATALPERAADLVHARFQLAPLGRAREQLATYQQLTRPGGILVVEDPDTASWHYTPDAPRTQELIDLILTAFQAVGGDFDAGRHTARLMREHGLDPHVRADVVALPPGHPYLLLPLQFATSLRPRLVQLTSPGELDELVAAAAGELDDPDRAGLTFTLMQTWARVRHKS
jgi:ubiquinone/menaquinone biosynthesis C-methylase UbiE